jgi:hypothetical protein
VRAHGHHAATRTGFVVKLIEVELDLFKEFIGRIVTSLDQQDVVIAPRVRGFIDYLRERLRDAWRWGKA